MSPAAARLPFDALFFDLGSTLIYFEGFWPEVMLEADAELFRQLSAAGLVLDEKAFLEAFRAQLDLYYQERESEFVEYTTQYVLRALLADWGYPDIPEDVLRQALAKMYAITQSHWRPEKDAIPTLEALKTRGYRLGLISNAADDADVQVLVDQAGIRGFFEVIMTSAAQGIRKPNPRIFEQALHFLGAQPERSAMVGDTLGADILGAQNAGIYSIWITRRANTPANRAHQDTIHPQATIQTLSELPELLEALAENQGG